MRKYLPTPKQLLAIPVAAGFLLLSGLVAIPAQAQEAGPGGFPSWSEVKTARGNAVATAAEIAKIAQALAALESETDLRGTAAVQAGVDYVQTLTLLDAVTAEVDVLNAQTQRASAQAGKDKKDAVSVAVQRYKRGGTGLGLFATMTALETP